MVSVTEAGDATRRLILLLLLAGTAAGCAAAPTPDTEIVRWQARAANVTIIRDDWGVPHIYAPTDADAVFGLMYAQAGDDFPRFEENFLNSQGRMAEAVGESAIWRDLRMQLFVDPAAMSAAIPTGNALRKRPGGPAAACSPLYTWAGGPPGRRTGHA
jgi:acyl-homoserine-lactone acylase